METETMKWLASLGVGGVLAGIVIGFYRKDMKAQIEQWRGQTEMLVQIVKENTASNIELIQVVKSFHKRLDVDHETGDRSKSRHIQDRRHLDSSS